jgi:outer membrane receptor protein involved in Fe transport
MIGRSKWCLLFHASALSVPLLAAPAAYGEAGAPQGETASAPTLDVITVTAQKIKEDVRTVPFSLSVVEGAKLEERHVESLDDLTRAIPNLSFSSQGGAGNQNLEIRGVSSTAGASTVSVYMDDIPLTVKNTNSQGQVEPRFFDVERVEVLRGPQGTLFGASSMGGTLRYIMNPVDLDSVGGRAHAEVSATKDGGINHTEYGVLNLPVIDGVLGVRIGVEHFGDGGYIDHYNPDALNQVLTRNRNTDHGTVVHLAITAKPNDRLTISPTLFYQDVPTNDLSVLDLGLGLPKFYADAKRVQESQVDKLVVPGLTINLDVGFADLTSVSGYFYRRFDRVVDGTYYGTGYLGAVFLDGATPPVLGLDGQLDGNTIGNIASPVFFNTTTEQFTQEVRLASKPYVDGGSPFTWLAGLFYSSQHLAQQLSQTAPGLTAAVSQLYGDAVLDSVFGGPFAGDQLFFSNETDEERQYAVFGDVTYHVTPRLRLAAGVRVLHARENVEDVVGAFLGAGLPPIDRTSTANATTPRVSVSYDVDRDTTAYATISKGFRLGGPNDLVPVSLCADDLRALGLSSAPLSYDADSLWNYEAGVKSSALDGRLYVSADAFYIKWSNIQQNIVLPVCGYPFNTNAGDATSIGTELEVRFRPIPALTLGLAAGYTHATLDQANASVGATKGEQIEGVPEWNATGSVEYAHALSDSISGFIRSNWNWVGPSHGSLSATDPDYERPVYDVLGASVGFNLGNIEVALFGTNLTDDRKIIQRPNLQLVNRGYTLQPLTLGLSVSTRF